MSTRPGAWHGGWCPWMAALEFHRMCRIGRSGWPTGVGGSRLRTRSGHQVAQLHWRGRHHQVCELHARLPQVVDRLMARLGPQRMQVRLLWLWVRMLALSRLAIGQAQTSHCARQAIGAGKAILTLAGRNQVEGGEAAAGDGDDAVRLVGRTMLLQQWPIIGAISTLVLGSRRGRLRLTKRRLSTTRIRLGSGSLHWIRLRRHSRRRLRLNGRGRRLRLWLREPQALTALSPLSLPLLPPPVHAALSAEEDRAIDQRECAGRQAFFSER